MKILFSQRNYDKHMITIKQYRPVYQSEIDLMINDIANEFELPISNRNKPTYKLLYDKYWIAFDKSEIVGTAGIINIKNDFSILKSMFVKKEYRGKD